MLDNLHPFWHVNTPLRLRKTDLSLLILKYCSPLWIVRTGRARHTEINLLNAAWAVIGHRIWRVVKAAKDKCLFTLVTRESKWAPRVLTGVQHNLVSVHPIYYMRTSLALLAASSFQSFRSASHAVPETRFYACRYRYQSAMILSKVAINGAIVLGCCETVGSEAKSFIFPP